MSLNTEKIEKIEGISKEDFYNNYYKKNIPVIIKDTNYQNTDFSKWSVEEFDKQWGNVVVPVQKYGPGKNHLPHFKEDRGFEEITVREFFKRDRENNENKKGSDSLLMGKLSISLFDGMKKAYELPKNLVQNYFDHKVWVYSEGSVTAMHFDVMDTFLVQGKGRKNLYFFEPGTSDMYPFKFFSKSAHFSEIDARNIDLKKYPKLDGRTMYTATLEEGEILYIPFGWWHQLTGQGEMNFALAYWYYPSLSKAIRYFFQSMRLWRIAFLRWLIRYPI